MIGRFGTGTTLSLLVRLLMKSSVQQINEANDPVVLLTSVGTTLIPKHGVHSDGTNIGRRLETRLNSGVSIDRRRKLRTSQPTAARMLESYIPVRSPKTCSAQYWTAPKLPTG